MTILFINIKHSSYRFYAFWCMQSRDFEMVNLKYFYIELIFSQLHSQSTYSKVSNHSLIFSIHIYYEVGVIQQVNSAQSSWNTGLELTFAIPYPETLLSTRPLQPTWWKMSASFSRVVQVPTAQTIKATHRCTKQPETVPTWRSGTFSSGVAESWIRLMSIRKHR